MSEISKFGTVQSIEAGQQERSAATNSNQIPHIAVCVCTYKRPECLDRLLQELRQQETEGLFTYSIVIADNDSSRSAEAVVSEFAHSSSIRIVYCVVPEQNISLARNTAIANARGEFVAFIDDDEFPIKRWLVTLYHAYVNYGVDGVLGPVKRYFDVAPPKWVTDSKFYDRKTHPTGTTVEWREGRTGNVMLKSSILEGVNPIFRPEFRGGEDTDFFIRMIGNGHKFVWCDEAVAYEVIPPSRWSRSFLLRRALLRGSNTLKYRNFGASEIAKSMVAVPLYALGLPIAFLMGQHRFMELLVSLFDHAGKLLAILKVNPIKEHYITE